jgi:hypothetical protein
VTGAPVKYDAETLQERILTFLDQKVILDADLALLYGVPTKALNQAVKRNMARFPADFIFQLGRDEAEEWRRLRSQSVTLERGQHIKHLPYAFTEQERKAIGFGVKERRAQYRAARKPSP